MKDDWENEHFQEPGDLDAILEEYFGVLEGPNRLNYRYDAIFGPEDLRDWPSSESPLHGSALREIVGTLGWPRLYELQGKFIFVLTGNSHAVNTYPTDWDHYGYTDQTCDGRAAVIQKYCFIAPKLGSTRQITSEWPQNVVFANVEYRPDLWSDLWDVVPTAHRAGCRCASV